MSVPKTTWQPIETAPKEPIQEVIGVRFASDVMTKEPFITFWSPSLQRFYLNPTHWMPLPPPPEAA
jgi:hypothetical protein